MVQRSDALTGMGPIGFRSGAFRGVFRRLRRRWWASTLVFRVSAIGLVVLLPATVWLGDWVNHRIAAGVLRGAAGPTALYLGRIVEPRIQSLARSPGHALSEEDGAALRALLEDRAFHEQVVSMKIWAPDGTILFSSDPSLIGQSYHPDPLARASTGDITISANSLDDDDHDYERAIGQSLFEIFVPLHQTAGAEIIAVAEFYVGGRRLEEETGLAARHAWMVVVALMVALGLALLLVVDQESRIVIRQRTALKRRASESQRLMRQNQHLLERMNHAQRQISRIDDRGRQRLGADLHDGPIQLFSYVLMRLGDIREGIAPARRQAIDEVGRVASEAIADLRLISGELILPLDAGADLGSVLRSVIARHEERTHTSVAFALEGLATPLPDDLIRYAARIVQEALTNAVKHAGGLGQSVEVSVAGDRVLLTVSDRGPGFSVGDATTRDGARRNARDCEGLGLAGIRARAEALGGSLSLTSTLGRGARLRCVLPLRGAVPGK